MRRYETIAIIDPDLSEEDRQPVLDRISDLISTQNGFPVMMDHWGSKKLAYEIKRKSHGYYLRIDFCGTGALVDEMERFFRIDDRILKYMTVLLEKDADIESIKEEIAKAEKDAEQAALSSQPAEESIPENAAESEVKSEAEQSALGNQPEKASIPENAAEPEIKSETEPEKTEPPTTDSDTKE
ncbi:MAG: 30S ribosomal protein S6 [Desulfobacterales bacterium]|jgi:small subunit ribosomal protein S6